MQYRLFLSVNSVREHGFGRKGDVAFLSVTEADARSQLPPALFSALKAAGDRVTFRSEVNPRRGTDEFEAATVLLGLRRFYWEECADVEHFDPEAVPDAFCAFFSHAGEHQDEPELFP